jgi:serine/threonine protein kinase
MGSGDAIVASGQFADCRLLDVIARAPDCLVVKAHQASLDRIVTLKIFTGEAGSEADLKRFYRDAKAASELDHPNIVPIYKVDKHQGRPYILMGFVEGQSLTRRVADGGKLYSREAAELIKLVAEAMHYAHGKHVFHLNLTPDTILLNPRGKPKIAGYASLRRHGVDATSTLSGTAIASSGFLAPELSGDDTAEIGPEADVYSLGAILYFLLSGRAPLVPAAAGAIAQGPEGKVAPLSRFNSQVPKELEKICHKCLRQRPRERYATAAHLAEALGSWLKGDSPPAQPPLIAPETIRKIGAVVVPLLICGLVGFFVYRQATAPLPIAGRNGPPSGKGTRPQFSKKPITPTPPRTAGQAVESPRKDGAAGSGSLADLRRLQDTTALVEVDVDGKRTYASSFCISKSGFFVTNYHVIETVARSASAGVVKVVLHPGEKGQEVALARIIRARPDLDLAVLRLDADTIPEPLQLGQDRNLFQAMDVVVFGFPYGPNLAPQPGQYASVSQNVGRISALRKVGDRLAVIQIDASLYPGNSGGPVLDGDGRVIGIVAANYKGEKGLNFAIPVRDLIDTLAVPDLSFDPAPVRYEDRFKPVEWTIDLKPLTSTQATPDLDVYVCVDVNGQAKPPVLAQRQSSGKYRARVVIQAEADGARLESVKATVQLKKGATLVEEFPPRMVAVVGEPSSKPASGPSPAVAALAGQPLATKPVTDQTKTQPGTVPAATPGTATCVLPGPVHDLAVGGGGRFLILIIKNPQQLAAYDLRDNRVVKSIPLIADDVLVAAGKTKFVIVSPGLNVIQRYDIATLEREKDVSLPAKTRTLGIGMGSQSEGPVFVLWQASSTQQQQARAQVSFLDLELLQAAKLHTVATVDPKKANAQLLLRDVKSFPVNINLFHMSGTGQPLQVFASTGGELFTAHTWPGALFVSLWNKPAGRAARTATPEFGDQPPFLPCPDGRTVLVGGGKVVDQYAKVIAGNDNPSRNSPILPTPQSTYRIRVNPQGMTAKGRSRAGSVDLLLPTGAVLLSVEGVDASNGWQVQPGTGRSHLTSATRLHFDPSSHAFAYIPAENDRIVWQKLDIDGAFSRLNDPLVILSPTFVSAVSGQDFRHQIRVRSRTGVAQCRLSSEGLAGLAVTPDGVVTWKVPAKSEGKEVTAVIGVSDGAGHEITSVLKILIR